VYAARPKQLENSQRSKSDVRDSTPNAASPIELTHGEAEPQGGSVDPGERERAHQRGKPTRSARDFDRIFEEDRVQFRKASLCCLAGVAAWWQSRALGSATVRGTGKCMHPRSNVLHDRDCRQDVQPRFAKILARRRKGGAGRESAERVWHARVASVGVLAYRGRASDKRFVAAFPPAASPHR
jgi:hypothetical protein